MAYAGIARISRIPLAMVMGAVEVLAVAVAVKAAATTLEHVAMEFQ